MSPSASKNNNHVKISLNKRLMAIGSRFRTAKSSTASTSCPLTSKYESEYSSRKTNLLATDNEASMFMLYGCNKQYSLEEIQALIERFPECLRSSNQFGQTPLHVAASKGLKCDILLYLIISFPDACHTADIYGKLPLHYAAKSSQWVTRSLGSGRFLREDKDEIEVTRDPDYCRMLKQMCRAHPAAATHEDLDGLNPIEWALVHADASPDFSIVKILQRAASKHWKEVKYSKDAAAATTVSRTPITQKERRSLAGCSA